MKTRQAILEYCVDEDSPEGGERWGFRLKSSNGRVLIDSRGGYASRTHAEQGFFSLVKSIATNQYSILPPGKKRVAAVRSALRKRPA